MTTFKHLFVVIKVEILDCVYSNTSVLLHLLPIPPGAPCPPPYTGRGADIAEPQHTSWDKHQKQETVN